MNGTIYLFTNVVNGKQYVGQSKEIERRLRTHTTGKSNGLLSAAIGKYGIENFNITLLETNITSQEELDSLEEKYIQVYNTLVPNGYNIRASRNVVHTTRLSKDQEQAIISLYNENVPIEEIAKQFNMSKGGITKCLIRNEVSRRKPLPKRNRVSKIDKELLQKLLNEGKSAAEIAQVFNTTYKYIWKYISYHKLKRI